MVCDKAHLVWGIFRFVDRAEASQRLFCKNLPELVSRWLSVTYFSCHFSVVG